MEMVVLVFVLYNIIFKGLMKMNHTYNTLFFAPPPWKPHSNRVRGIYSEEGVNKHSPSRKESAF